VWLALAFFTIDLFRRDKESQETHEQEKAVREA
jgi:hypothetical protein